MWETYSIQSKIKKPRVSIEEFMDHYHMGEGEIEKFRLQEFLDFFELSKDDIYLRSKEEILFAIQGFVLDREAEKAESTGRDLSIENIGSLEFRYMTLQKENEICGEIDFKNSRIHCANILQNIQAENCALSDEDKWVLYQAFNDLHLQKAADGNQEDLHCQYWEFILRDEWGNQLQEKTQTEHPKILLKIIKTILLHK